MELIFRLYGPVGNHNRKILELKKALFQLHKNVNCCLQSETDFFILVSGCIRSDLNPGTPFGLYYIDVTIFDDSIFAAASAGAGRCTKAAVCRVGIVVNEPVDCVPSFAVFFLHVQGMETDVKTQTNPVTTVRVWLMRDVLGSIRAILSSKQCKSCKTNKYKLKLHLHYLYSCCAAAAEVETLLYCAAV